MPLLWSLPEALLTAELSSAFPEAAGGVAWVEMAFGKQAGWLCGYLGWVSGATDNAIYPVLFLDYVIAAFDIGDNMNAWERWFWLSTCSCILAYINWLGLPTVGRMSMVICVIAMSPFILLTILGVTKIEPEKWLALPPLERNYTMDDDYRRELEYGMDTPALSWGSFKDGFSRVLWAPFLNNLYWNGNSFDSCASFSGDVEHPGTVLPRALSWSVVMVACSYLIPLLVTLGADEATSVQTLSSKEP